MFCLTNLVARCAAGAVLAAAAFAATAAEPIKVGWLLVMTRMNFEMFSKRSDEMRNFSAAAIIRASRSGTGIKLGVFEAVMINTVTGPAARQK